MDTERYKLTYEVGELEKDEVVKVTRRFGGWHLYDVRLEPVDPHVLGSAEVTEQELRAHTEPVPAET